MPPPAVPLVLLVSKPVAPPWNDSSKNLVKDLAQAASRFHYRVLTPRGYQLPDGGGRVQSEELYSGEGSFSPALLQNLRVLGRLLRRDDSAVTHFFFAPNRRAARGARLALRLRHRRTVQTVCSTPRSFDEAGELLFAERVVVLSEHTQRRFVEAGVAANRLRLIPPGIRVPASLPDPASRAALRQQFGFPPDEPLVIYPGDYQFSSAAETLARAILQLGDLRARFIFACRIKQAASLDAEARIHRMLEAEGGLSRVRLLREVPDMLELLGACDLCVLPAESLYAKMDLPLVLLEAMALGLPLLLADRPPLTELVQPAWGSLVPPGDPAALAAALRDLLAAPEERRRQMGAEARRQAMQRFRIEEVARQYEDLYQEMIEA